MPRFRMFASVVRCCRSYARTPPVVCVDCVSAGATAYQAFWRRFLGRYGEYGDVDIGGGSIPKRGSPRFITRVVGAYDSIADEWVHQRVTESESDDDSVEALTVRTPLQ